MNPANKYLNDNKYCRMFGNLGFSWLDRERKITMGTALAFTVVAIVITGFGCFALSGDAETLRLTAWGISFHQGSADGSAPGTLVFLGLRKFVVQECTDATGDDFMQWTGCKTIEDPWWSDIREGGDKCQSPDSTLHGYACDDVQSCADQAISNQFGAFSTCVTLLAAMMGCLTRIKKKADTNFQKIMGCVPDTIGCITLFQALVLFKFGCYDNQADVTSGPQGVHDIHLWAGPGYYAYMFCWLAAVVRTFMHYVTPLPGGGAGCALKDVDLRNPAFLATAMAGAAMGAVHMGADAALGAAHMGADAAGKAAHMGVDAALRGAHAAEHAAHMAADTAHLAATAASGAVGTVLHLGSKKAVAVVPDQTAVEMT